MKPSDLTPNANNFRWFRSLMSISLASSISFCGCNDRSTSPKDQLTPDSTQQDYPYENGYAAYEDVQLIDGSTGLENFASGTVVNADGIGCESATVTADIDDRKDGKWVKPKRCIFGTTDDRGHYDLRGEPSQGTSIYWATANGQLGVSPIEKQIELRGGETIVHVRDEKGVPIANASVTVHLSSIDDMSYIVPPNIRAILQKTTDSDGIVRYPSRLGDYELGFEVKAPRKKILTRCFYSGLSNCRHKLFVVSVDEATVDRCRKQLAKELSIDLGDIHQLQVGSPGHFHGN